MFIELPESNVSLILPAYRPRVFLYIPSRHGDCAHGDRKATLYEEMPFASVGLYMLNNVGVENACATFYVSRAPNNTVVIETCDPVHKLFQRNSIYLSSLILAAGACHTNLRLIADIPVHFGLMQLARSIAKHKKLFDKYLREDEVSLFRSSLKHHVDTHSNRHYAAVSEWVYAHEFPENKKGSDWWKHGLDIIQSTSDDEALKKYQKYTKIEWKK